MRHRSHFHRDDLVHDLAEAEIPFVIESMDISDTPEVRDLFACLNAIVSSGDDISLVGGAPVDPARILTSGQVTDSYLLALAEASQAEFLVTGDKELLSLKHHKSTRIITPAAMIEALKAQGGE